MAEGLTQRIARRIAIIPVSNPAYLSVMQNTLGSTMSRELIDRIAEEAAQEANAFVRERSDHRLADADG